MPLNREQKNDQIDLIKKNFEKATASVLLDFRGVDVDTITELRVRFRQAGIECKVVKNNLVEKALKGNKLSEDKEFLKLLAGPTAVAWSYEDPSAAAKLIRDFRKEKAEKLSPKDKPEKLLVKCGLLDGVLLDAKKVETQLANLPGKNEIRASLLAQLMAPMQRLVGQLSAPGQNFAFVLDAQRRKLEQG